MKKKMRNRKGFTLIELIVVIAILGILAAVAIPRLTGFQESARIRTDNNNARLIANSVSVAMAEGKWKVTSSNFQRFNGSAWENADIDDLKTDGYLDAIPTPQSETGSFTITVIAPDSVKVSVGSQEFYPTPKS